MYFYLCVNVYIVYDNVYACGHMYMIICVHPLGIVYVYMYVCVCMLVCIVYSYMNAYAYEISFID